MASLPIDALTDIEKDIQNIEPLDSSSSVQNAELSNVSKKIGKAITKEETIQQVAHSKVANSQKIRPSSKKRKMIIKVEGNKVAKKQDYLVTEEPLEIRLRKSSQTRKVESERLSITMRTPGTPANDFELVTGLLYNEGLIQNQSDIQKLSYCVDKLLNEEQRFNVINVQLKNDVELTAAQQRTFMSNSACGVCGKSSLDALHTQGHCTIESQMRITPELIQSLPDKLMNEQGVFTQTGGIHAAALFDTNGNLLALREDVGRHNALDKLIGWAVLEDKVPLENCILLMSSRASFELIQKAVVAGIPMVCALSAPSSLAVQLADEFGISLVAFLRDERFNIYSHEERILLEA